MGTPRGTETAQGDPRRLEKRAALAALLAPWPLVLGMTLLAIPIGVLTFVAAGMATYNAIRGHPGAARNWLGGVVFGAVAVTLVLAPLLRDATQIAFALVFFVGWPIGWSVVAIVAAARAESLRRLAWGRDHAARQAASAARQRPPPPVPPGPVERRPARTATADDDEFAYLDELAGGDGEGGGAR